MAGPQWLRVALAALLIVIALGCVARLCFAREARLGHEGLHAARGVAMAGWQVVRGQAPGGTRPADVPLPRLLECVAMAYMLLAAAGKIAMGVTMGYLLFQMA